MKASALFHNLEQGREIALKIDGFRLWVALLHKKKCFGNTNEQIHFGLVLGRVIRFSIMNSMMNATATLIKCVVFYTTFSSKSISSSKYADITQPDDGKFHLFMYTSFIRVFDLNLQSDGSDTRR